MNNFTLSGIILNHPALRRSRKKNGRLFCHIYLLIRAQRYDRGFIVPIYAFEQVAKFICSNFAREEYILVSGHIKAQAVSDRDASSVTPIFIALKAEKGCRSEIDEFYATMPKEKKATVLRLQQEAKRTKLTPEKTKEDDYDF